MAFSDKIDDLAKNFPSPFDLLNNPYNTIYGLGYFLVALFVIAFVVTIPYLFDKLLSLIFKKKFHNLRIEFSKFVNFNDILINNEMEAFFKAVSQTIGRKNQFGVDIIKNVNQISLFFNSDSLKVLEAVKIHAQSLKGSKTYEISTVCPIPDNLPLKVNTVAFTKDIEPINFIDRHLTLELVKNLSILDSKVCGISINLKKNYAKNRLTGKIKDLNFKNREQKYNSKINTDRIERLTKKISNGELLNVRIYTFAQNVEDLKVINANYSKVESTIKVGHNVGVHNLINHFVPADNYLTKAFVKYSYFNCSELSKLFTPFAIENRSEEFNNLNHNFKSSELIEVNDGNNGDVKNDSKKQSGLLLKLNGELQDSISIYEATNHIIISGDPGSGKSSGGFGNIIESIIKQGYGALFTTSKQEESYVICGLAKKYSREKDIILINPKTKWRTNLINEEYQKSHSITNLIRKFETINKMMLGVSISDISTAGENQIWEQWANQLTKNVIILSIFAEKGKFKKSIYTNILQEATTYAKCQGSDCSKMPSSLIELSNNFKKRLNELDKFKKDFEPNKSFNLFESEDAIDSLINYFKLTFVGGDEKRRDGFLSMVDVSVDAIKTGNFGRLLISDDEENYFSLESIRQGSLVILDLPVSKYQEEGKSFQEIFKLFFQEKIRDYDKQNNLKECFIVSDEFQEFGAKSDVDFSSIARSAKVGMIYGTQNIPSLIEKLGEIKTEKLLGNFKTKIFFSSDEQRTIEYTRKQLAEKISNTYTTPLNSLSEGSVTSNRELELLPDHLKNLNEGLDPRSPITRAILYKSGKKFVTNNKDYLMVNFNKVDEYDNSDYLEILESQKLKKIEKIENVTPKIEMENDVKNEQTKVEIFNQNVVDFQPENKSEIVDLEDIDLEKYMTMVEACEYFKIGKTKFKEMIKDSEIEVRPLKNKKNLPVNYYNIEQLQNLFK